MPRARKAPLTRVLHKQTLTFAGAVLAQLPQLPESEQQRYISKPQLLARVLRDAFVVPLDPWTEARLEQERFYNEVLGMEVSLTGIRIPDAEGDLTLPLIIHEDLVGRFDGQSIEGLFQIAKARFGAWKYTNETLDTAISEHERHPGNGSYAVLVRDRVEADEENANLSANQVSEMKVLTETILERIFHELFYNWKSGEHLDVRNLTLCAGSRYRDGGVPSADWHGEFGIDWYSRAARAPGLHSRSVRV